MIIVNLTTTGQSFALLHPNAGATMNDGTNPAVQSFVPISDGKSQKLELETLN